MTLKDYRIVIKAKHINALLNRKPHKEYYEAKTNTMNCGCGNVRDLTDYEKFRYGQITHNKFQMMTITKDIVEQVRMK